MAIDVRPARPGFREAMWKIIQPSRRTATHKPQVLEAVRIFSPAVEHALRLQSGFAERFREVDLQSVSSSWEKGGGEDHVVKYFQLNGISYAVKELKPNSREVLAIGGRYTPQAAKKHEGRIEPQSLDTNLLVEEMQAMHAIMTAYIGADIIAPTAILIQGNRIYRVQRQIKFPEELGHDRRELNLRVSRQLKFYADLEPIWRVILASPDFAKLSRKTQEYYRYFGIDIGDGSNAIFRGLFSIPEFVIIDY